MTAKRKGSWIQTWSGKAYWPVDPRAEEVAIEDIAHALSMLCRYTGHCRRFYSVAEHSLHVANLVPEEHRLAALMHDATEAYINDLSRPLKQSLPDYRKVEEANWLAIAEKFDLPLELPPEVKAADGTMLWVERRALLLNPAPLDWGMGVAEPNPYPEVGFIGWPAHIAKERFRARFEELTR